MQCMDVEHCQVPEGHPMGAGRMYRWSLAPDDLVHLDKREHRPMKQIQSPFSSYRTPFVAVRVF